MMSKRSSPLLKMLIDLRWMIPGQSGGLETVAYCFIERLFAQQRVTSGEVAVTIVVPWELADIFRAAAPDGVAILSRDSVWSDAGAVVKVLSRRRSASWLRAADFDVVYTLNGRLLPEAADIPSVVLVADLQHLVYPQFFEPQDLAVRTAASRDVALRASHIVTISEFSRQEIIRLLGVDAKRVSISHLAVDPVLGRLPSAAEREGVLARYGLSGRSYVVLPAQVWPHKNHETVVAALDRLRQVGHKMPMLVSTGRSNSPFARDLMVRIAGSDMANYVKFQGLCPPRDLVSLYAGAEALVFCSRYEGFGMPLIEAMQLGCPVVASNTTSIPEVVGEAALLVDPDDADAIASSISRLIGEPDLRSRLIEAGHARAANFSWDRHFDEIFAALHVCAGHEPQRDSTPGHVELRSSGIKSSLGTWFRTSAYPRLRRHVITQIRR